MPTHGTRGSYVRGCRCYACTQANRIDCRDLKTRRVQKLLDDPDIPVVHGKPATYSNWDCRCDECKVAWRESCRAQAAARKRRVEEGDPSVPHGTAGGYKNWGCRCDDCKAAYRTYRPAVTVARA